MGKNWTFGQKLGSGFAVMIAFAILIGGVAAYALRATVESKDRVITHDAQIVIEAERLQTNSEVKGSALRGYLIAREQRSLDLLRVARGEFTASIARLQSLADADEERRLLSAIERASESDRQVVDDILALARTETRPEVIEREFEDKLFPARDRLRDSIRSLVTHEQRLLEQGKQAATDAATRAVILLSVMTVLAVRFAIAVAVVLTRSLARQIGTAVGHVQSSSSELQSAATQQASGAKEQASAMNEITTTISELVATSRQIAESAQRVAQIAEQTATAARHGEGTVEKGRESSAGIRRQVDQVVNHMLDLGKKSQQIGAVLEIVAELAEQTNILAINATIEASGAGEAGKRFAVVADEIRKLADRVASSTKDIRGLIDDVRGAVNTTVMATESSAKAVEAGARQFAEVAVAFKQIAGLVGTTTDAAREIELSTKQQATAAEQVRTAVADVAQATNETEASTGQTLQTASQLATLSRELLRLIQPQAANA
ncbi:MAG: CHASE3 domain-containing protein [Betaproteobacteria bacterium]|nr:CHASE3 domain-containing protein [Betaproteobacteria bacterium]